MQSYARLDSAWLSCRAWLDGFPFWIARLELGFLQGHAWNISTYKKMVLILRREQGIAQNHSVHAWASANPRRNQGQPGLVAWSGSGSP